MDHIHFFHLPLGASHHEKKVKALLHQISYINVSNSLLPLTPQAHLDMRGIDVARVVLLVWHKFNPILLVRNHVAEAVALCVFGQSCRGENAVRPLLGNLLVLSEDPLLFQLQLQGLTLERKEREREKERERGEGGVGHWIPGNTSFRGFSFSPQEAFIRLHSTIAKRPFKPGESHYNIRPHL